MPSILDCKCVLVIGATSGIGRALALAIHALPSEPLVIVAGRRQGRLDELLKEGDRIRAVRFDVNRERNELKNAVQDIVAEYRDLDAVIFSSGIQELYNFTNPEQVDLDELEREWSTNYTAIVIMITFFLPHFLKLSQEGRPSFIIPITSGLAMTPAAWVPNYCATKAALHSFSLSLNAQLKNTKVNIMEIMPPLVESELHDHQGTAPMMSKFWMPLVDFTKEAMEGLKRGDLQIPVGTNAEQWNEFEKGKIERVARLLEHFERYGA
ncbi:NAD(P)-binding protein [Laetiporus sulphureus 93-53]|uniref:NAD(P)-binding protein n=1 Tax=Laetiporus sulphureus 93-53 TaxID=1314785 RepID=A0A165DZ06_9APHY|nr:NAD(P)-binding protein [Laetiporus sulphureus 93-53]KZT05922.1 NAD(P)-binding protein [Laetiporus sulphureus 93-53]